MVEGTGGQPVKVRGAGRRAASCPWRRGFDPWADRLCASQIGSATLLKPSCVGEHRPVPGQGHASRRPFARSGRRSPGWRNREMDPESALVIHPGGSRSRLEAHPSDDLQCPPQLDVPFLHAPPMRKVELEAWREVHRRREPDFRPAIGNILDCASDCTSMPLRCHDCGDPTGSALAGKAPLDHDDVPRHHHLSTSAAMLSSHEILKALDHRNAFLIVTLCRGGLPKQKPNERHASLTIRPDRASSRRRADFAHP